MSFKFEFTNLVRVAIGDGPMEPENEKVREAIKESLRDLHKKLKGMGGAYIELTATIDTAAARE